MKPEEAIKIIEYYYPKRKRFTCGIRIDVNDTECTFGRALTVAMQALEEIQEYREIGTVEECRKALEKQIPKAPDYEGDGYDNKGELIYDTWICPNCGERYEVDYDDYEHCPKCGQAIHQSENLEGTEDENT